MRWHYIEQQERDCQLCNMSLPRDDAGNLNSRIGALRLRRCIVAASCSYLGMASTNVNGSVSAFQGHTDLSDLLLLALLLERL